VALFSYDGNIYWGFNADYDVVSDVDEFAAAIEAAFGDLYEAAVSGGRPVRKAKKKPKKRPPMGSV
jgi:hypothetical protein